MGDACRAYVALLSPPLTRFLSIIPITSTSSLCPGLIELFDKADYATRDRTRAVASGWAERATARLRSEDEKGSRLHRSSGRG